MGTFTLGGEEFRPDDEPKPAFELGGEQFHPDAAPAAPPAPYENSFANFTNPFANIHLGGNAPTPEGGPAPPPDWQGSTGQFRSPSPMVNVPGSVSNLARTRLRNAAAAGAPIGAGVPTGQIPGLGGLPDGALSTLADAVSGSVNQFGQQVAQPIGHALLEPVREPARQLLNLGLGAIGSQTQIPPHQADQQNVPLGDIYSKLAEVREKIAPGAFANLVGGQQNADLIDAGHEGLGQLIGGLTTDENLGFAAIGHIPTPTLAALGSGGFSVQMFKSAYDQVPAFKDAIDRQDWPAVTKLGVQLAGTTAFAGASAMHAAGGVAQAPAAIQDVRASVQQAVDSLHGAADALSRAVSMQGAGGLPGVQGTPPGPPAGPFAMPGETPPPEQQGPPRPARAALPPGPEPGFTMRGGQAFGPEPGPAPQQGPPPPPFRAPEPGRALPPGPEPGFTFRRGQVEGPLPGQEQQGPPAPAFTIGGEDFVPTSGVPSRGEPAKRPPAQTGAPLPPGAGAPPPPPPGGPGQAAPPPAEAAPAEAPPRPVERTPWGPAPPPGTTDLKTGDVVSLRSGQVGSKTQTVTGVLTSDPFIIPGKKGQPDRVRALVRFNNPDTREAAKKAGRSWMGPVVEGFKDIGKLTRSAEPAPDFGGMEPRGTPGAKPAPGPPPVPTNYGGGLPEPKGEAARPLIATSSEANLVRAQAKANGYLGSNDVPGELARKLNARMLLDQIDQELGTTKVGKHFFQPGQGNVEVKATGSVLPESLQQGKNYEDIRRIIRKGLTGEPMRQAEARYFQDVMSHVTARASSTLDEAGLHQVMDELGIKAPTEAEHIKAQEAEATANPPDEGDTSFPTVEEPLQVYHGSPHEFDRFDKTKIGTGEGAQAYGHGLYFAERRGVAEDYKRRLGRTEKFSVNDVPIPEVAGAGNSPHFLMDDIRNYLANLANPSRGQAGREFLRGLRRDVDNRVTDWLARAQDYPETAGGAQGDAMRQLIDFWDTHGKNAEPGQVKRQNAGKLYTAKIPGEPEAHYLNWDVPLSEQTPEVQRRLKDAGLFTDQPLGRVMVDGDSYKGFIGRLRSPEGTHDIIASARPIAGTEEYGLFKYERGDTVPTSEGIAYDAGRARRWVEQRTIDARDAMGSTGAATGENFYRTLGSQSKAAQRLHEAGIAGIKYADQGSRNPVPTRIVRVEYADGSTHATAGASSEMLTAAEAAEHFGGVRAALDNYNSNEPDERQFWRPFSYEDRTKAADILHKWDKRGAKVSYEVQQPQPTHNYVVFDDKGIAIDKVEEPRQPYQGGEPPPPDDFSPEASQRRDAIEQSDREKRDAEIQAAQDAKDARRRAKDERQKAKMDQSNLFGERPITEDKGRRLDQRDLFGNEVESPRAKAGVGQEDLFKDFQAASDSARSVSGGERAPAAEGSAYGSRTRDVARLVEAEIRRTGAFDARGKRVGDAKDVAALLQPSRDPRMETHRFFAVDRDGNIVAQENLSSEAVDYVKIFSDDRVERQRELEHLRTMMRESGATGYWLTHNHPSEDSRPSSADIQVAQDFSHAIPGLRGSVIINHGHYSYIETADGRPLPRIYPKSAAGKATWSTDLIESIPHPDVPVRPELLGHQLLKPEHMASYINGLKTPDGFVTLAHLDSKARVRRVQELPIEDFIQTEKSAPFLAEQRRQVGARQTVAYTTSPEPPRAELKMAARELVRRGGLIDLAWSPSEGRIYGERSEMKPGELAIANRNFDKGDVPDVGKRGQIVADTTERSEGAGDEQDAGTELADKIRGMLQREAAANDPRPFDEATLRPGERRGPLAGVRETLESTRRKLADIQKDVHQGLSPSTDTQYGRAASSAYRRRLAEAALSTLRAQRDGAGAIKVLDKMPQDARDEFIAKVEAGDLAGQGSDELKAAHTFVRTLMDQNRNELLGVGKLRRGFYENYFPHLFKRGAAPENADKIDSLYYGKRPFEGPATFLKKRNNPTYAEALPKARALGLEPAYDNPIEAVLATHAMVQRFLAATRTIKDGLGEGWIKKVYTDYKQPGGWKQFLPGGMGTIYGDPNIPIRAEIDSVLNKKLQKIADDLGIRTQRIATGGQMPQAFGYHEGGPLGGGVTTRFATSMGTFAHEIGHALDERFGMWDAMHPKGEMHESRATPGKMIEDPKAVERRTRIDEQLRNISDLRGEQVEGGTPPKGSAYIRSRSEKMAHIVDAYVNDRARMREVAPDVANQLEMTIAAHKELQPLRRAVPSMNAQWEHATVPAGGKVIAGQLYAPPPVVRLFENHLAPGLQGHPIYQALRAGGNSMNHFQLGFSGFHGGFVTVEAMVSKAALGIEKLAQGRFGEGLKDLASTPLAPITAYRRGLGIERAALSGELNSDVQNILDGGGRFGQDAFYSAGAQRAFQKAWREQKPVSAAMRAPMALAELVAKPLMEKYVPRIKNGVMAELADSELHRLGEDATPMERRYAMARAQDTTDERLGQVIYDNTFMNRTAKDLAFLMIRSVGWSGGTIKHLGGAALDVATLGNRLGEPKGGPLRDAAFTHRMAYSIALPTVVGMMGAIYQKLATGKDPESVKDYFFPQTGKTNPDGSAERISLPSYMKDVFAYGHHPLTTITNKANPMLSAVSQMIQNKDYYGTEIRDPEDEASKQAMELAAFAAKQYLPFSVTGYQRLKDAGEPFGKRLQAGIGLTPAPAYIARSEAQAKMADLAAEARSSAPRDRLEVERSRARGDLENLVRKGDMEGAKTAGRKYLTDGTLTLDDVDTIEQKLEMSIDQVHFKPLPLESKLKVWDVATPAEKEKLRPLLAQTLVNADGPNGAFSHLNEDELARLVPKLRTLIRKDPKIVEQIQELE